MQNVSVIQELGLRLFESRREKTGLPESLGFFVFFFVSNVYMVILENGIISESY